MTEEEFENFVMVEYRMDNEGIDYCFESYSRFDEIKDEEFHRLRNNFLTSMKEIRNYVENKIKEGREEYGN
jgi:hypothetical protein